MAIKKTENINTQLFHNGSRRYKKYFSHTEMTTNLEELPLHTRHVTQALSPNLVIPLKKEKKKETVTDVSTNEVKKKIHCSFYCVEEWYLSHPLRSKAGVVILSY